jgi:Xylose isomerase-like TIM barrel
MSDLRGDWPALVAQASELSPFAVELSALSEDEMDGLAGYLASDPQLAFRYVSIHGPSKGRTMPEPDLVNALAELAAKAQAIIMHPDTIEDPSHFRVMGRKLVLENMDSRKDGGRTVEELASWFADLPDAGFCFDIAHAWSVDDTLAAGAELLDAFRPRLRHVHVSSMDTDLHHVPLTEEHEALFMPLLQRCTDVPWIFEAPPRHR